MLSQRTVKSLFDIRNTQQLGLEVDQPFDELQQTFNLFDKTLSAFDQGGETIDTSGGAVVLKPVDSGDLRRSIAAAKVIWQDYSPKISNLTENGLAPLEVLSNTNKLARASTEPMLTELKQLKIILERKSASRQLVNLADEQRSLMQRMVKSLSELGLAGADGMSFETSVSGLRSEVSLFDVTLRAFSEGGSVSDGQGQTTLISAFTDRDAQSSVQRVFDAWAPLKAQFDKLLRQDSNSLKLPTTLSLILLLKCHRLCAAQIAA